ncbi:threonine-phosphate decarboxylase CobD [Metabacillus malikii]|uniref:threonine-phosphate decarboxylase n=1 Tax=Metabacillus malikii TaxID=1504265 RepID=A0ABT9ZBL4_9BACI|nr:threonine-phosphate decarboxylase CobD [Metabacillus malikii]MDQ0228993.1 threonine-phosphate decarboxylase [Metabacillus malikii]
MKWPNHGGQPETIKKLLQIESEKTMLDFSANLNPLGPPSWLKESLFEEFETVIRYPDPTYEKSTSAIATNEEINENQVLVTNGGAEAIFLAAKNFEGGKALVVQPTFLEYERACSHYNIEVEDYFLDMEDDFTLSGHNLIEKLPDKDVIFICRPNNPTGTVIPEEILRDIVTAAENTGTYVVVDEAFADFLPASIPPLTNWLASFDHLILLRSLTKMYTIPGLRFGYLMASPTIISKLKGVQIPWSINALADSIVPKLLNDKAFLEKTKVWLADESEFVLRRLNEMDLELTDTKTNFYLLRDKKAPNQTEQLFRFLLQQGIVTRHTHNFKGLNGDFLRIAIRSRAENERLIEAFQKWRQLE